MIPLTSPVPGTAAPAYGGDDAVTVDVRMEVSDRGYIEGALYVVRLDGSTNGQWVVDGQSEARIAPGDYTAAAFEQVCSGNCGNLASPSDNCSVAFSAAAGQRLDLLIRFGAHGPCTAEVVDGP